MDDLVRRGIERQYRASMALVSGYLNTAAGANDHGEALAAIQQAIGALTNAVACVNLSVATLIEDTDVSD